MPAKVANRDEAKREWVRSLPCLAAEKHRCVFMPPYPWEMGHRSRLCHYKHGSKKDDRMVYPGCDQLHEEHHSSTMGEAGILRKYGISLELSCAEIDEIWRHRD